ncbi:MAG: phosphonate metabolism protein/1,5-bisphosphokinase (PRPP-forming) PhnN [Rhodobacteraceae bacterium]|nr:phosphonate metabolism protein/1,5-bisphosphokinase (PRPP-forming) PhnN [Paracoccaceae bacterium]
MAGRFVAFVGPSGVGKDTVMEATAASLDHAVLARRVVTRPADAGGEIFDAVSDAEFRRMADARAFALSWSAHGLHYGIPTSVDATLAAGKTVLANLSRSVLVQARDRFAQFHVILLTAPPAVLAARLAERGRETQGDITTRLLRAGFDMPDNLPVTEISNDRPLKQTVQRVLSIVQAESA